MHLSSIEVKYITIEGIIKEKIGSSEVLLVASANDELRSFMHWPINVND